MSSDSIIAETVQPVLILTTSVLLHSYTGYFLNPQFVEIFCSGFSCLYIMDAEIRF